MLTKSNVPFKVKQKKLMFDFLDVHQPKTTQYLDRMSTELASLVGFRRHKILGEIQKRVGVNKNTEALVSLAVERSGFDSPMFDISQKRMAWLKLAKTLREDRQIGCFDEFVQLIEEGGGIEDLSDQIYSDIAGNQRLSDPANWNNSEWVECFNFESLAWILRQSKEFTVQLSSHADAQSIKSQLRRDFSSSGSQSGPLSFKGPKSKLKKSPKLKSNQVVELAETLIPYIAYSQIEAKLVIANKAIEWSYPSGS